MKQLTAAIFFLIVSNTAFAWEPPPLEKTDAKRIVEGMTWTEITVVAIRQGVDGKGAVAPIYATVIGLGKLQGQYGSICQTVYFDKDLDWHAMELSEKCVRLWNRVGYQEIKPWTTW